MRLVLFKVIAPLLSLSLLILGNGLFMTLVTVRLHLENASVWFIGLVSAAYYAGLAFGSIRIERFIYRVGHIRAYAAFAAILTAVTLLQGLWLEPWVWVGLRFIGGYCLAGLFVVIESWLLGYSTATTRGQVLSLYMIALYGSQSLGQFLLNVSDPATLTPFCIVSIFSALSIVPISMTYSDSPHIEEASTLSFKKLYAISPLGVVGCFAGGLTLGAIYGFYPLFLSELSFPVSKLALIMGLLIVGGMLLQYPIGHLSDIIERRKVLLGICLLVIGLSIGQMITSYHWYSSFLVMVFLFGGLTFTIYPVSISHACDHLEAKDIAAATGGLLFAYSLGATIGPLIVPAFMRPFGPLGLFIYFIVVAMALAGFTLWRMRQTAALKADEKQEFVAVPAGVSPVASELHPLSEETAGTAALLSQTDDTSLSESDQT